MTTTPRLCGSQPDGRTYPLTTYSPRPETLPARLTSSPQHHLVPSRDGKKPFPCGMIPSSPDAPSRHGLPLPRLTATKSHPSLPAPSPPATAVTSQRVYNSPTDTALTHPIHCVFAPMRTTLPSVPAPFRPQPASFLTVTWMAQRQAVDPRGGEPMPKLVTRGTTRKNSMI
jgi:hypothetical protein